MPENAHPHNQRPRDLPSDQIALIARQTAEQVILQHLTLCPFTTLHIEKRLRDIEVNYARLIGFMFGSGLLGGAAGGTLIKLFAP